MEKLVQSVNHDMEIYGIKNATTHRNLSPEKLTKICVEKGIGKLDSSGVLAVNTDEFTGRSPLDRFIVKDDITENKIWWGNINLQFEEYKFDSLYQKVVEYLSGKELYARDAFVCADDRYRLNLMIITELP